MLFKALLIRLSSSASTTPAGNVEHYKRLNRVTYKKYPQLANLVEDLLQKSCFWRDDELVLDQPSRQIHNAYPAMEIINRIGIMRARHETVHSLLFVQLDSPVWALREKAARTLSNLVDERRLLSELKHCTYNSQISQNRLHGRLLCLRFRYEMHVITDIGMLRDGASQSTRLTHPTDLLLSNLADLMKMFASNTLQNSCPYTMCTYLELMTQLLHMALQSQCSSFPHIAHKEPNVKEETESKLVKKLSEATEAHWRVVGSDSLALAQKIERNWSYGDCIKYAFARFVVSLELLRSRAPMNSLPKSNSLYLAGVLEAEIGLAYLETTKLFRGPIEIHHLLLAMQQYMKCVRSQSVQEDAVSYLGQVLNKVRPAVFQTLAHSSTLKQEVRATGLQTLAAPSFTIPKNPFVAQSALRARGSILSLLYYCETQPLRAALHGKISRWTQDVRLSLEETCVSRLIANIHSIV